MSARVRVAVCADFAEEGWPSMDRVAARLLTALAEEHPHAIDAVDVRPPFVRRALRIAAGRRAANVDRGLNRLLDYPAHLAGLADHFDLFHIVDHSYAQLAHRLPPERVVVTCHDLDTFQSVLDPARVRRSPLFRAMTQHILRGFQRAACIVCDTATIRDEILARSLVPEQRVIVAPLGVGDEFSADADPDADAAAARLLGPVGPLDMLHVGSTIARKRIDRLLEVCAAVRMAAPGARLIRVGGALTAEQRTMAAALGLTAHIVETPAVDDRTLAAVYRRARVTLLSSDREGFGLPVLESLRCGTPVVATDLPVLREVGGTYARYCAADAVQEWVRTVLEIAARTDVEHQQDAGAGQSWAGRFTWSRYAEQMSSLYQTVARREPSALLVHSLI